MPEPELQIEVVSGTQLPHAVREEVLGLLDRAYGEPMASYLAGLAVDAHILGRLNDTLVTHAAWVTRYLQAGSTPLMRAAYVELVATDPTHQGAGYASKLMRHLARSIAPYDIGALAPSEAGGKLYTSLGWECWRGPLHIRGPGGLILTPGEQVMVLRLPKTPDLDLDAPLSAEWRPGELW